MKKIVIICTGMGILSLAVGSGLWAYRESRMKACEEANTAYIAAFTDYTKIESKANEAALSITGPESVTDQTLFEKFTQGRQTSIAHVRTVSCDELWVPDTQNLREEAKKLQSIASTLSNATRHVLQSHEEKLMNDARSSAHQKLDEATALYTSSENQVADNATRDTLKGILDTLQNVISDTNATVESLTTAQNPVQGAVDAVNQSKEAKKVADEQKAREEAEAQARAAQAQAQAAANARNANRRAPRSSAAKRKTTNTTPRRSSGNTTPAPANNAGSSRQWYDEIDWDAWGKQKMAEAAARGEYCPPQACM